jgi:nucleoside-diphosphate-sugar epimerase
VWRFLVTGAAGFLGSHVSEALLAHGDEVVGLDNFDPFYGKEVKQANLKGLLKTPKFRFVEGDIRDRKLARELITKDTLVVHLAARAGVRPSIADPELYVSVNIAGTNALFEACFAA